MLKRKAIDLNINHERWLVSYADFVTLLFAFFVVMYSASQLNENKYQELTTTLAELFSSKEEKIVAANDIDDNHLTEKPIENLPELANQFKDKLEDLIDNESIQVSSNEFWLQISLNNKILFSLGSVTPSETAETIFKKVANILRNLSNPIQVEGFTDNLAINTLQFPSNWELSAARAAAIVKLLVANGVSPTRLSAIGYGEFQPIADNNTPEGQAKNRRVVLMIGKYHRQRPEVNIKPTPLLPSNQIKKIDTEEANEKSEIKPVTLKNGEYLFSSDPDLPRLSR